MRIILPLIQLFLLLVPLSCAQVDPETPKFNCEKALDALKGQNVFRRPNEVPVDPKSPNPPLPPSYLCLNEGAPLFESPISITYQLEENNGALYLLKLNWHQNIEDPDMTKLWKLAEAIFEMPEHPSLVNMKKFVENEVDADGNPVQDDGTKSSKDTWHVYYTLTEYGQHGNLRQLLARNPNYAHNGRWIGRTLFKIAQAVQHLHTNGKIHTDIHMKNVVFGANFEPKLTVSVKPAGKDTPGSFQGPIESAAPEVLALKLTLEDKNEFTWSEKQDTFSLGVLMSQMFDPNEPPFGCKDVPALFTESSARAQDPLEKRLYVKTRIGKFRVRSGLPFWAIRVLHGLLRFSKESRWGDDEILEALKGFGGAPAKPNILQAPATGSKLTVYTPIEIPKGSSPGYIVISTRSKVKEPEDFEAQNPEVLKNFETAFPSFLYELEPVHRFNLVR